MQQGERVIVKLDPDFNPTGKPMPDTILEQMKADPDFDKLSETEQKKVINKVKNLVKDVEDVNEYGTLKEKLIKIAALKNFYDNKKGLPFIMLSDEVGMGLLEAPYKKPAANTNKKSGGLLGGILIDAATVAQILEEDKEDALGFFSDINNRHRSGKLMFLKEGSQVNAGQGILSLIAIDATSGSYTNYSDYKVADIKAPISGAVFSLAAIQTALKPANWNEDLFIVSSIPGDTREEAIKWYKETTGKIHQFKTNYDKRREAAEQKKNVDDFLSKWNL